MAIDDPADQSMTVTHHVENRRDDHALPLRNEPENMTPKITPGIPKNCMKTVMEGTEELSKKTYKTQLTSYLLFPLLRSNRYLFEQRL